MNSRAHPKYKTQYRVNNWASYDRALVECGDITIWLSPEALAYWEPARPGYHRQGTALNAFFRYKSIIGDRLRARHPGAQEAEALIACNVLNRMFEIGRPISVAVG